VPSEQLEVDSCDLAEQQDADTEAVLADLPALAELTTAFEDAFADVERVGIALRRTGGEWYVSPIGTLADGLLAVTGALDRAELDRLLELFPAAIDELATQFGGPLVLDPTDLGDGGWSEFPGDGTTDDGSSSTPTDPDGLDPVSECYSAPSGEEAASCFADLLATGQAETWEVPAELRFPECGVADLYWTGYSSLGDEEFFEAVEPARPCFLDVLESGQAEASELPYWVEHLDCFEDRNWYATFGDDEYDQRFFECVQG
jgi:hypothetical protein